MTHHVTDIQPQVKRKNRISIYLDGEFWSGAPQILAQSLQIGQVLSQKEVHELAKKIGQQEALHYAVWYLERWRASNKKIAEKLKARGYPPIVIEYTLQKCQEYGYLNDEILAEGLVLSAKESGKSRRKAQDKLKLKGIDNSLAEKILEENYSLEEEEWAVEKAVNKFPGNLKDRPTYTKAVRRLLSQGYPYPAIQAYIKHRLETEPDVEIDESPQVSRNKSKELEKALKRYGGYTPQAVQWLNRRGWSFQEAKEALVLGHLPEED